MASRPRQICPTLLSQTVKRASSKSAHGVFVHRSNSFEALRVAEVERRDSSGIGVRQHDLESSARFLHRDFARAVRGLRDAEKVVEKRGSCSELRAVDFEVYAVDHAYQGPLARCHPPLERVSTTVPARAPR